AFDPLSGPVLARRFTALSPYTTLFRSSPPYPGMAGHSSDRGFHPPLEEDRRERPAFFHRQPGPAAAGPAPAPGKRQGEPPRAGRSEEHTSELQSRVDLVCRLLLENIKI